MALWNAPHALPGHQRAACISALRMQTELLRLCSTWEDDPDVPKLRYMSGSGCVILPFLSQMYIFMAHKIQVSFRFGTICAPPPPPPPHTYTLRLHRAVPLRLASMWARRHSALPWVPGFAPPPPGLSFAWTIGGMAVMSLFSTKLTAFLMDQVPAMFL